MLWQVSPQHQNMPHEAYLRTPEGQRSQQAFSQWNDWTMSLPTRTANAAGQEQPKGTPYGMPQGNQFGSPIAAPLVPAVLYGPGQAQPSQPQSKGSASQGGRGEMTPAQAYEASRFYNSAGQPFDMSVSWAPGTSAEDRQRGYAEMANSRGYFQRPGQAQPMQPQSQGSPYGAPPKGAGNAWGGGTQVRQTAPTFTPGGGPGNMAYAPPDQRPPPFQQRTTDWTGRQIDPTQGFAQRGAFVQNINQSRAQHASQWGQGMRRPPPRGFGGMWGQAGDMAKSGWQNPLSGLFGGGNQGRRHSGFARDPNEPPPPPGVWY
jgi:hypothetical protein